MRKQLRWAQKEQAKLCTDVAEARSKGSKVRKKEKVCMALSQACSTPGGLTAPHTPPWPACRSLWTRSSMRGSNASCACAAAHPSWPLASSHYYGCMQLRRHGLTLCWLLQMRAQAAVEGGAAHPDPGRPAGVTHLPHRPHLAHRGARRAPPHRAGALLTVPSSSTDQAASFPDMRMAP